MSNTEKEQTIRVFVAGASGAIGGTAIWLPFPWVLCGFVALWRRTAECS
jgi:hypothetical protein